MDSHLKQEFAEIEKSDSVTGCVIADSQGLCLLASPHLKPELAGLVTAMMQLAQNIEPENKPPMIILQSDVRECFIQREEGITTALFKKVNN